MPSSGALGGAVSSGVGSEHLLTSAFELRPFVFYLSGPNETLKIQSYNLPLDRRGN